MVDTLEARKAAIEVDGECIAIKLTPNDLDTCTELLEGLETEYARSETGGYSSPGWSLMDGGYSRYDFDIEEGFGLYTSFHSDAAERRRSLLAGLASLGWESTINIDIDVLELEEEFHRALERTDHE